MAKNDETGRVDLNTADADQLTRIEGIDATRARRIVEHRTEHGAFETWEDFEAVPGIDPALRERIEQAAVLGGQPAAARAAPRGRRRGPRSSTPDTASKASPPKANGEPHEEAAGEVELDISPVELLATLARVDLEAALAYEAAASRLDDPEMVRELMAFAKDHRRHVADLNRVLEGQGEPTVVPQLGPGMPLLTRLLKLGAPLGPDVVVVALLGNEQLTNLGYDCAVAYDWDDDIEAMLEGFRSDEERHLAWLAEKHDAIGEHAPESEQPGPLS